MKKTFTVNIGGIVFHIDEDAYDKLNRYLNSIRAHFSDDDGREEIIAGIESRIAEMFQEKTRSGRQVIGLDDVQDVIRQLGEPRQIRGDEEKEETNTKSSTGWEDVATGSKRLFRDPDDKYLGGVCGGLGAFFQIDPTWVRILFLVAFFFGGTGLFLYIILWIVIPKATTRAERLEMRGEKVNLSTIEKSIREDLDDIKKNLKDLSDDTKEVFKKKKIDSSPRRGLQAVLKGLGLFLLAVIKIVGMLIGVVFVLLGLLLLTTLVSSLFFVPLSPVFIPELYALNISLLLKAMLGATWLVSLASAGIILLLGIPLLLLVLTGLELIFGIRTSFKHSGALFFFLWMVGLSLSSFVAIHTAQSFRAQRTHTEEIRLDLPQHHSLYLKLSDDLPYHMPASLDHQEFIFGKWQLDGIDDSGHIYGVPRLRLRRHSAPEILIRIEKTSWGPNGSEALEMSRQLQYGFQQQDSLFVFDPLFWFESQNGWRAQQMRIEMTVPEHLRVEPDQRLKRWLY